MARAPDPRIDEAKAMYLKGVKLVEIAHRQLPQGSLRLSFLIAWNRKSGSWRQLFRRIKSSCSSRRSGC